MASFLPKDLILEILSRLSLKTLLQFKCVSKQWYEWISDPWFRTLRCHHFEYFLKLLHISLEPKHSIVNGDLIGFDIRFTSIDKQGNELHGFTKEATGIIPCDCSASICQDWYSCNGLTCFKVVSSVSEQIYICNPATRELVSLLPVGTKPSITFGFGYLPSTQEYKVVRLFWDDEKRMQENIHGQVFSFTTRRTWESNQQYFSYSSGWRDLPERFPRLTGEVTSVSVNGYINWLPNLNWLGYEHLFQNQKKEIVSLDLTREKFGFIPLPPSGNSLELFDFGGRLSVVERITMDGPIWKFWIMEDDGKGWTNAHTIDITSSSYYYGLSGKIRLFSKMLMEKELMMGLMINGYDIYLYYNFEDKGYRSVPCKFNSGELVPYSEYLGVFY